MTKSNYTDLFTNDDMVIPDKGISYIPWETIQTKLGEEEYIQFMDWMNGQSCSNEGAYACDVRNYFYRRNRGQLNGFPHGY